MIVASTGKWDVLHHGHFHILHHIVTYADVTKSVILILVDSDARIIKATGKRPVFTAGERVRQLDELLTGMTPGKVFSIYVFDFDEELEDIYRMQAAKDKVILIKGSEWRNGTIIGRQYVDVYFLDSGSNKMSSTFIKQRIIEWHETNERPI